MDHPNSNGPKTLSYLIDTSTPDIHPSSTLLIRFSKYELNDFIDRNISSLKKVRVIYEERSKDDDENESRKSVFVYAVGDWVL